MEGKSLTFDPVKVYYGDDGVADLGALKDELRPMNLDIFRNISDKGFEFSIFDRRERRIVCSASSLVHSAALEKVFENYCQSVVSVADAS